MADRRPFGRTRCGVQSTLPGGAALCSTVRLWDNGAIDPRHTRRVLALALDAPADAPLEDLAAPAYRM